VRVEPSSGFSINLSELVTESFVAFEFDEAQHPRDADGKFAPTEGGDTATATLPKGWRAKEPGPGPLDKDDMPTSFAATYKLGGTEVEVNVSGIAAEKIPVEMQHEILQQLDTLDRKDPIGYPLRVNVLDGSEMRSKGAAGETFTSATGSSVIELNANALTRDTRPTGDTVLKKLPDVSIHDYAVTHEYGHALQNGKDTPYDLKFARERIKIEKATERPSAYGDIKLTNEYEAYAEAYSDWRLNPEPGPLAHALAEHDGWGKR
jgi:hypothetical protein